MAFLTLGGISELVNDVYFSNEDTVLLMIMAACDAPTPETLREVLVEAQRRGYDVISLVQKACNRFTGMRRMFEENRQIGSTVSIRIPTKV